MAITLFIIYLTIGIISCKDPDLFEGDIVLDAATKQIMSGKTVGYDGISNRNKHWHSGVIPYVFANNFDSSRRTIARQAMTSYRDNTCIRFKPRTVERDYIRFMVGGGCYSNIGRAGGQQDVSIGNGCNTIGTVIHELMHAVGFFHEQSRRDRDQYVHIYWNNIPNNVRYNFNTYSHGEADYFGEAYDLNSVMHYRRTAFGIGGRVTIASKRNYYQQLGSDYGFSKSDIRQINAMYSCNRAGCVDGNTSCGYWAGRGECKANPSYMLANCKRSCRVC